MPQKTASIKILSVNVVIEFEATRAVYYTFTDWIRNALVKGEDWLYLLPTRNGRELSTVVARIVVPFSKRDFFLLKLGSFCAGEGYDYGYRKTRKGS